MRAIDTNVLVRLITRDNERQAASADDFVSSGAWASLLTLAETVWVLDSVYGLSAAQLITALEMLLENKSLVLQDAEAVSAALEIFRSKPSLGFSDCLGSELARRNGHLPLGTFDRKLATLQGTQRL